MRRSILGALLFTACSGGTTTPVTPDAGTDVVVPPPPVSLSEGLIVSEIAFYETVKISVAKDGAEVVPYNAPLITDRKGLARVFMAVANKKYKAHSITAELHIVPQTGPEKVLVDTETLAASSEADLGTTFNFHYDETALQFGTTLYVVVKDPKTSDTIRFPTDAPLPLTLTKNPGRVRVRMVPVRYTADGSNRMPDTSPAQIALVKTELTDIYPTNEIDIDVRQTPVDSVMSIAADGTGWQEQLQAIVDARAADAPPSDIYYVGWFQPRPTFGQYCQNGCIVGLATTADPAAPAERAVLAVGYSGDSSASTVGHEIGHTMGRHHAPCGGAQGIDPKFPYPDGSTGVPGWRQSDDTFLFDASDIMGYCAPFWISDYTYKALAARISVVNALGYGVQPSVPHDVQRILIAPNGALTVGKPLRMTDIMGGSDVTVIYKDGSGKVVATAHGLRYGYDHLPGGFVLVMDPPSVSFATVELF